LAAKRIVTEQLRAQGVRVTLVLIAEINARASVYLAEHSELYEQAEERARLMALFEKKPKRPRPRIRDLRNSVCDCSVK
jgi:hypothetical protein